MNSEEHDTKESEKDNKNCILYIKKKLTKIKKNIDLNVQRMPVENLKKYEKI